MNESEIVCSVVIRCCNEEQHIGRLLSGILEQTLQKVEILVVDSGSADATLAIASRFPVKIVSIRPEEFSFGRSLNIGCREAQGEFLVFASAHVYPLYRDWLERLVAPFKDPDVALVYGKQRGVENTKYSEHQVFARWFPEQSNPSQDNPFCNNANAAIRRRLWQQVPYDEMLTGLEDIDWAKRVMALGRKIAYEADATIIHVHNETARQVFNRYRREAIALKQICPEEHFNLWDFLRLYPSNVFSDGYHAARDGQLARNLVGIPLFRLMQYWGAYRGFRQHGPLKSKLKQRFYYPKGLTRAAPMKETPNSERKIRYSRQPKEKTVGDDH